MDNKTHNTHHEEVYNSPRRNGGGLKNHCKKLWWCWLGVAIALGLIIFLPILFVAVPNKAQHDINQATVQVTNEEVTNPTSDSVHIKIDNVIKSSSAFHPDLDGFKAALSLKGQPPFIFLDVPKTKADAETKVTIDQDAKIANMDSFINYAKTTVASENYDIHMDGVTYVHLGSLKPMKVNFNKVINMKGLNGLKGLNITDTQLLVGNSTLPDGSNLIGVANIMNPSVMLLDLGDVTMDLSVDGKPIGTSLIQNFVLKPNQMNRVNLTSKTDIAAIAGLITKYPKLVLPIDITGNSSIKNGQHLTYYEEALKSAPVRVDLDVKSLLGGLSGGL